jgi:hypothetical protein
MGNKWDFNKVSKRLEKIKNKLNKRDAAYLEGFVGHYLDVAQDLDYRLALLNGTWPKSAIIKWAYDKWLEIRLKDFGDEV